MDTFRSRLLKKFGFAFRSVSTARVPRCHFCENRSLVLRFQGRQYSCSLAFGPETEADPGARIAPALHDQTVDSTNGMEMSARDQAIVPPLTSGHGSGMTNPSARSAGPPPPKGREAVLIDYLLAPMGRSLKDSPQVVDTYAAGMDK